MQFYHLQPRGIRADKLCTSPGTRYKTGVSQASLVTNIIGDALMFPFIKGKSRLYYISRWIAKSDQARTSTAESTIPELYLPLCSVSPGPLDIQLSATERGVDRNYELGETCGRRKIRAYSLSTRASACMLVQAVETLQVGQQETCCRSLYTNVRAVVITSIVKCGGSRHQNPIFLLFSMSEPQSERYTYSYKCERIPPSKAMLYLSFSLCQSLSSLQVTPVSIRPMHSTLIFLWFSQVAILVYFLWTRVFQRGGDKGVRQ
ncbi:hypothetical protein F5Y01DRAFT_31344 [Xylaria sp. FL0043]|nr:hypothetical protein F5Y01DRAFT_31344 [Xylaria sp. FL0043]